MKLLRFVFILFFCLSLCLPCFAHSGKTDSKGGHRNSSTRQYHYHHGYPAHSHYDMDHNGTIDCPYQFKNNTSSSSKTNTKKSNTSKSTNIVESTSAPESESSLNNSSYPTFVSTAQNISKVISTIFVFLLFLILLSPFIILSISVFVSILSFLREKLLQRKKK